MMRHMIVATMIASLAVFPAATLSAQAASVDAEVVVLQSMLEVTPTGRRIYLDEDYHPGKLHCATAREARPAAETQAITRALALKSGRLSVLAGCTGRPVRCTLPLDMVVLSLSKVTVAADTATALAEVAWSGGAGETDTYMAAATYRLKLLRRNGTWEVVQRRAISIT